MIGKHMAAKHVNGLSKAPIEGRVARVLHVVEGHDHGAAERWLVEMLACSLQQGAATDWTFYCTLPRTGELEAAVYSFGGRICRSSVPMRNRLTFMRELRAHIADNDYDVIHCHHDLMSAVYIICGLGVTNAKYVVHVHNMAEAIPTSSRMKQVILRKLLRAVCLYSADKIVGVSGVALDKFLCGRNRTPGRDIVLHNGISLPALDQRGGAREEFRRELGLPNNAILLLFVGRLVPEKNPLFSLKVMARQMTRDCRVRGIFVGEGALARELARLSHELGISHRVSILGWRDDARQIMQQCDVLLLPSENEGFGLVVLEAQLAGLKLLISTGVPEEVLLPGSVVQRVALSEGLNGWENKLEQLIRISSPKLDKLQARVRGSSFDIERSFQDLLNIYR